MKKIFLFSLFLITTFFGVSQNLKTNDVEVYLHDYIINEVNISKGMYMTENKQYFYEGKIEVVYIESKKTELYQFYFSTWDKKFKEFAIKDSNYNILEPSFAFNTNSNVLFVNKAGSMVNKDLENTKNVDYAILSSMLIWLETQND